MSERELREGSAISTTVHIKESTSQGVNRNVSQIWERLTVDVETEENKPGKKDENIVKTITPLDEYTSDITKSYGESGKGTDSDIDA